MNVTFENGHTMKMADKKVSGKGVQSQLENQNAPSALWWHDTLLEDNVLLEPIVTAVLEDAKQVEYTAFFIF